MFGLATSSPWMDGLQALCTANLPLPVRASDWRAVKAYLEPRDLAAYRTLLPSPLAMPEQPLVLIEFAEVSPTWHEGIVSVACRFGDTEGWHGLYWAIDSWFPYAFGLLVGYPKFMADRMTLAREDTRWRGDVVHGGRTQLSIECTADDDAARSPVEAALLARLGGPATERPYFLQVPAGRGPWINRLTYRETVGRPLEQRAGRVVVRCDVDEPWAALFPEGTATGASKMLETHGTGFGWLTSQRVG
jgi:hypothetical protein